jgi:hypothetical protein
VNETFSVVPGGHVDSYQPHGFSYIYSVWVDNFSGGWLRINNGGLWVPPYTRGWKATIFPGTTAITVTSYDFANGNVIAGATGQAAQVTIWDAPNGDDQGVDFFDAQTVPITVLSTHSPDGVFFGVTTVPTVGRLRIYDASFSYYPELPGATIYDDVAIQLVVIGGPILAFTSLSPASPSTRVIINPPGGDIPIGTGLSAAIYTLATNPSTATWRVSILLRYAVI